MRRHAFRQNERIRLDGNRYRITALAISDGVRKLTISSQAGLGETVEQSFLEAKLAAGELTFDDADDDGSLPHREVAARRKADEAHHAMLPEDERKRIAFKRFVIEHVDRNRAMGMTSGDPEQKKAFKQLLHDAAALASAKIGCPLQEISRSTYFGWRKQLRKRGSRMDLRENTSARGRRDQLPAKVKDVMNEEFDALFTNARVNGTIALKPVTDVMSKVADRLPGVQLPHTSTFYRHFNQFSAYDRDFLTKGKQWTQSAYRHKGERTEPEHALDIVQFDETRLRIFVVHDILNVPLGRPWLGFLIDVFSYAPVGFALSFTPPSDALLASSLRHACMPKAYMPAQFCDLTWPYSGVPRYLVFDNGFAQHSKTAEEVAGNADIEYAFCKRRTPWGKAVVEGFFKRLNARLLSELQGYCLPPTAGISLTDYDPSKHAILTLSTLYRILHHFFLGNSYAHATMESVGMSPAKLWEMGTRSVLPEFPSAAKDVDLLFGIRRNGRRLDHNGARYQNLEYWSEDLARIRRRRGAVSECDVCVNPDDLERIFVLDDDGAWRPSLCLEPEYARGLTLHQHKLIRSHALATEGRDDLRARLRARADLRSMVQEVLTEQNGMRAANLAARFLGVEADRFPWQGPEAAAIPASSVPRRPDDHAAPAQAEAAPEAARRRRVLRTSHDLKVTRPNGNS